MVGSLDEFAEVARAKRYPCAMCTLPPAILKEATQGFHAGKATAGLIVRWLREKGHKVCYGTVVRHFNNRHGEKK